MIPASFEYEVAASIDDAVELLARHGEDAKLLAGGQSLLPLMKLRLARPSVIVDIGRIESLSYVREIDDLVTIGALTRHHDLQHSDLLRRACPIMSYAASLVGDPQVRHRGTIGGSSVHGDPASDLPAVLVTLEAEMVARGAEGERLISSAGFFRSMFEVALEPGEILTEIRVPKLSKSQGWSYLKFNRRAQDWAIVGVAALVERSNGSISGARVGLANMGPTPLRAMAVESALDGGGDIPAAAELGPEGTAPVSDVNASAEFREHLSRILVRRAIEEALGRR